MRLRADGRFGVEDPMQWPQYLSPRWVHYALITRRPSDCSDPCQIMWWMPSLQDFEPAQGLVVSSLGVLGDEHCRRLGDLVCQTTDRVIQHKSKQPRPNEINHINFCEVSMRTSFHSLSFPSTFRDIIIQVTNVQRYWLEANAWLDWMDIYRNKTLALPSSVTPSVRTDFMGGYSTDPKAVARLYQAGIPVWLLRQDDQITSETIVQRVVGLVSPSEIVTNHGLFPDSSYYSGLIGDRHHEAVNIGSQLYLDIVKHPHTEQAEDFSRPRPPRSGARLSFRVDRSVAASSQKPSNQAVSMQSIGPHRSQKRIQQSRPCMSFFWPRKN